MSYPTSNKQMVTILKVREKSQANIHTHLKMQRIRIELMIWGERIDNPK